MAIINGVYVFSPTDKSSMTISNGNQSDEGDVNTVWETVDTKLSLIGADMAAVNAQATNAELWATEDQGVDLGTDQYSSEANALEAEEWASSEDGIINKADGTTPIAKSSKEHSEDSATSATESASSALASATSANFDGTWSAGTYNQPSSVFYNGEYWNLDAVSTTGEPGVSSDWIAQPQGRNKKLLINPNFKLNQEGYVDGATVIVGEEIFDCWKVLAIGATPKIEVDSQGNITLTNVELVQTNDDLIATSNGSDVILTAGVASGDVPFSDQVDESDTITPSSPLTFTYNSATGLKIKIGSTVGIYTFSGLKLEEGSIATKYEIPVGTLEELKCYGYLYYINPVSPYFDLNSVGLAETQSTQIRLSITLPVPLKDTPIITGAQLNAIGGGGDKDAIFPIFSSIDIHKERVNMVVGGFDGLFNANTVYLFSIIDGYLKFDSRY